ncbi:winged helix-turn-helix domain-containing protein [Clostridium ragsdalei]|nr:helix-turn-helix domain-containing protein [Clostridium ragsdalei]
MKENILIIDDDKDIREMLVNEILYTLASNKGRVYSTKMLYEMLWKDTFMENDNTVTMHVKNLRNKLGDNIKKGKYIKTIWGVGYKIENDI